MTINTMLNSKVGTFSPTLTFVTPGDLSVSYSVQSGKYVKIATLVLVTTQITCTPTFTTASGLMQIASLPFSANGTSYFNATNLSGGIIWFANVKQVTGSMVNGNTFFTVQGLRTSNTIINFNTTTIVTGVPITLNFTGFYYTNS